MYEEYIKRLLEIDLKNRDIALDSTQALIQTTERKEVKKVLKHLTGTTSERRKVLTQAILNAFQNKMLGDYINEILS